MDDDRGAPTRPILRLLLAIFAGETSIPKEDIRELILDGTGIQDIPWFMARQA